MSKRVVLATDGTGLLDLGEDVVVTNVAAAFRQSASLTVFGKGFSQVPDDVDEDDFSRFAISADGTKAIRDPNAGSGDDGGGDGQADESGAEEALRFLNSLSLGELSLRLFASSCSGSVVSCSAAVKILSGYQSRKVKVRSAFTGHLEIGEDLKIPVRALTRTQPQKFPSLSKCT